MKISNLDEARDAAREYAIHNRRMELIEEALREYAERRREAIGRGRKIGPLVIGFRREAPALVVKDEEEVIGGLTSIIGCHAFHRLVEQIEQIDRPAMKKYLRGASDQIRKECELLGIWVRRGSEKWFISLARKGR